MLEKIGFEAAIKGLIKEIGTSGDFNITSSIETLDEQSISSGVAINTCRILQQALIFIIIKHSTAQNVSITLFRRGPELAL